MAGRPQVPLSFAQQRFWIQSQMYPEMAANVVVPLLLSAAPDRAALFQAISAFVDRHEILRSGFTVVRGTPKQDLGIHAPPFLESIELEEGGEGSFIASLVEAPFDLAAGPPVRFILAALPRGECMFAISASHIVFDGWSAVVALRELPVLYSAAVNGEPADLPPVQSHSLFAESERNAYVAGHFRTYERYWKERLEGVPQAIDWGGGRGRPRTNNFDIARERFSIDAALSGRIRTLARGARCTVSTVLLLAYAELLSKRSSSNDIVVGCPLALRHDVNFENTVGPLLNMIPVRIELDPAESFHDRLRRLGRNIMADFANGEMPIDHIVRLAAQRSVDRNPLYQVAFFYQLDGRLKPWSGLGAELLDASTQKSPFDLTFTARETPDGTFSCCLGYPVELFDRADVVGMAMQLETILASALDATSA